MEIVPVFSLQSSVLRKDSPGNEELLPPYLASTLWVQGKAGALKTRDYTRALIESNAPEGMVLTVPVVGGSSSVKRLKANQLEVSGHGDWPRIHLGAIEAAYGREPYFQHLFPEIAAVIADFPQHLAMLNVLLMEKMMEFIGYADSIKEIRDLRKVKRERCEAIARRLESKIDTRHSLIEPLFRLGPDAIFLL
ncbi:MAG: WbqC family protein [Muribaculaceae bacterium]|nr:WbqC family protein [Muribaculaceae bacterium]